MEPRLNPGSAAPDTYKALVALEIFLKNTGLEYSLYELVKTRASQINKCAYCLNMHTTDARAAGESEQRLYMLPAWRESSLYSPRERAALAWTESLTNISTAGAPDAEYADVAAHFNAEEQVNLTALIGMINIWNRVSIGFNTPPAEG